MKNRIYYLLLVLILALGLFLRFYKLGEVPNGFYQDESAIGYNAYSIILTGKDEHGVANPLYFKSFGDYKLPIYIYATIPAIKLFGMTEFAIRFPSAFFGFLTLIVAFFFVKEFTKNKILALISVGLLAINPWSLDYNRATFEVSISLFLFVLGGLLLHLSLYRKIPWLFLAGTLCFVLDIYTYNLTRLLSPLLFLIFVFPFKNLKNVSKIEIITTIVISIVALIPFGKTLFGNGGISSAGGTLLFSSAVVKAPLIEMKSYLVGNPLSIFFATPIQLLWQYGQNIFAYLSIPFFFISGSTHGNHGIGNFGEFYLFELPLIVIGIIAPIKLKELWKNTLIAWIVITILVAALTRDIPQATRSFFMVVPLEIFSAFGLIILWNFIWKIKHVLLKWTIIVGSILFVSYNILFYFTSYYFRFPILYAKQWRQQDKALSNYLKENADKYNKIIIDNNSGLIYSSLLFFQKYSPVDFQKTAIWTTDDSEGMSRPISFGKYEFKDVDWEKDTKSPNTLIVTSIDKKPVNLSPIATFLYPKRPIVIAIKQEISSYPVEDIAYVALETK